MKSFNKHPNMPPAIVVLTFFVGVAMIFGYSISRADSEPQTAAPAIQCQYPNRSTNPPGGCDNSDPCDPASAAKGGSGECADAPKDTTPSAQPIQTSEAVQEANKCQK